MENVRKWARDSNMLFSKEDIKTANRYVKKKKGLFISSCQEMAKQNYKDSTSLLTK